MNISRTIRHSAVRSRLLQMIGAIMVAAMLLIPGRAGLVDAKSSGGLLSDTQYVSEQFLFELTWDSHWRAEPSMVKSVAGSYDQVVVIGIDGAMQCFLTYGNDLEGEMQAQIDARTNAYDDVEVVDSNEGITTLGFPFMAVTLSYVIPTESGDSIPVVEYIEVSPAYAVDLDAAILASSVVSSPDSFASTYDDVQSTFDYNEGLFGPLFAGQPSVDGNEAPRTTESRTNASLSEDDYLATLTDEFDKLTESIDEFTSLLGDPNLGDQASITKITNILNSWIDAYDYAQSLTPPSGYEKVHEAYLEFTGLLAGAAEDIFNDDLVSAGTKLVQAQDSAMSLADLLSQPVGTSLLDRKSG